MTETELTAAVYSQIVADHGPADLLRRVREVPDEAVGSGADAEAEDDFPYYAIAYGVAWGIARTEDRWAGDAELHSRAYRAANRCYRAATTVGGLAAIERERS